jgi:ankyrin repeat protein
MERQRWCSAAKSGHEVVLRLLLAKGADVNAMKRDGETALVLAAGTGHEAVLRLLLEKGADVNAMKRNGETALVMAAKKGHEAVVQPLLEKELTSKRRRIERRR